MSTDEWVPITSLIVKYPKGDQLGKLLAYSSLLPFSIIAAYITLILMVRDVRVIFMFVGQLMNECLCLILKKIFKQARPPHDEVYLKIYGKADHGYGMPSQHSQFQAFFTVFAILYLSNLKSNSKLSRTFYKALQLGLLIVCSIVIYSRVYLIYHYWSQCLVGVLIGSIWAFLWFKFNQIFMEKYLFAKIMNWKISKFLHLTYVTNEESDLLMDKKKKR